MNTLQKDIDALNWSIVGPQLAEALKAICLAAKYNPAYQGVAKIAEAALEKAEAINV